MGTEDLLYYLANPDLKFFEQKPRARAIEPGRLSAEIEEACYYAAHPRMPDLAAYLRRIMFGQVALSG